MEPYPRTVLELERRFPDDVACRAYLAALRWPNGFVCPTCGPGEAWPTARGLFLCKGCRRHVSVTAGTVFHRSKTPLTIWFRIAWQVTGPKGGASALGVQRAIGLGGYQTAWTCLHKLRRAMVRPGRDRLRGTVEVDETLVGGVTPGLGGRSPSAKMLVAIAAEVRGAATGRIRLAPVPNATKPVLHRFVASAVEPGSVVRTDGWHSYAGIEAAGYVHEVVRLNGKPKDAGVAAFPRVHRVASLLKRWLDGTHQGAVGPAHLERYLDEFAFRFNRRTSRSRGLLFHRLLEQAVRISPTTYREMVDPNGLGQVESTG